MIRRLLVWILLIALPLQSFAAAAMLHCASSHHAPIVLAAPHKGHDHANSGGHAQHADAGDHHHGHAKADKCSACGSCCTSAVSLIGFRLDLFQPVGAPVLVAHPVKPFRSITLDSPQRPPRPSLA